MPHDIATEFPGIIIRLRTPNESVTFPTTVKMALAQISSQAVGQALLNQITALVAKQKWGYTVCIMRPGNLAINDVNDGKGPQWNGGSVAKRAHEDDACNGTGCVTSVTWNPNVMSTPDGARPGFIALAHELIHALYNLKGEASSNTSEEEYRTVGLPPRENTREITENRIRDEHGIPPRATYAGLDPPAP